MATLSNAQSTFKSTVHANWIPNKCHWFETGNNGLSEIGLLPGEEDFEFQLILKQNTAIDCGEFQYYDSFKDIKFEFDYPWSDEQTYMIQQPKVNYTLTSPAALITRELQNQPTEGPEVEDEARTQKDLIVIVTIPKEEQIKIPVWTYV